MEATRKAGKGKNTVTPFKGMFLFWREGTSGVYRYEVNFEYRQMLVSL